MKLYEVFSSDDTAFPIVFHLVNSLLDKDKKVLLDYDGVGGTIDSLVFVAGEIVLRFRDPDSDFIDQIFPTIKELEAAKLEKKNSFFWVLTVPDFQPSREENWD